MSLQNRILALFLALLLPMLLGTLATVSRATYRHTMERAREDLDRVQRLLLDRLDARHHALVGSASALAKDDALRQAIFGDLKDWESVLVALNNHRLRTRADLAFLVELDGTILADTGNPESRGKPFPLPGLLGPDPGTGARVAQLSGEGVYQLVCVPYYVPVSAPRPSLWLLLGEALDDAFAMELRDLFGAEVSILGTPGASRSAVTASSLPLHERRALARRPLLASREVEILALDGQDFLALAAPLAGVESSPVTALVLQPTAEALLDYRKLSGQFLGIALASALMAVGGAFLVARSVTRPIRSLEEATRRIAEGDYAAELPDAGGEVGHLAREFDSMRRQVREREETIHHLAFHDDLTGLPNRNQFRNELARSIEAAAEDQQRLAVAVLDVDHFKDINDALGHHVGDRLLREIANRLQAVGEARQAPRSAVQVARLGDDEFGLLVQVGSVGEARRAIEELRGSLCGSLEIDDLYVDVGASVGIALYPDQGTEPAALLQKAEVAMYVAKERRLAVAFFDNSQDRHSIQRLSLMADLRRALSDDALHLCYQPKLDLTSGQVEQVEVLVRWTHPRLGAVSPAEFIPIAEQTGLIREITAWVLRRALEQVAAWQGLEITVAVNISALDLYDQTLPERLAALLAETGVPARCVVLEITESSMMGDPDTARGLLEEVTAMGATISVDDFGTGYSSLAQLKRLPVHELKVDKSFVIEMTRSPDVAQIVRTTIELGHNLGLVVVAEGVESRECLEALQRMGCDLAQGNYVSEPLPAEELAEWLLSQRARLEVALEVHPR